MTTSFKYAALASVFVLTMGSAAWAQNNNPNAGTTGNSNPGVQSSLGQSGPGAAVTADTEQKIQQALDQQGFKDVRVLPESFVIRAEAPDGSRVVMLLSPDMVSGFIAQNGNQEPPGTASSAYGAESGLQTGNSLASRHQAQQELSRYGYTNLSYLHPMQGWTADATRNGENVRVLISDNGLIATFRGK